MQFRTLALATTSLVALGLSAQANAADKMMGDLNFGFGLNWEDWNDDVGSEAYDLEYPAIFGGGRVNVPYSDTVNVQFDVLGRTSLDQSFFSGKGANSQAGYFAIASHLNYRDDQGMLGVFGAVGRVNETFYNFGPSAPIFMTGIEGQYYCDQWTFRGQLAYLDSDESYLLSNAGAIRVGTNYYVNKQLKLTGDVAYIAGDFGFFDGVPVEQWAWGLGAHYWFGKSMPVSGFVEYRGRNADGDFGGEGDTSLEQNAVNFGVIFHFGGGDGFEDTDRNGASADLPDLDWYRLAIPD